MRKPIVYLCFAALSAPIMGLCHASQSLAQKNQCLACHTVDKKLVGPSYKEVAAKYKGQADAEATLVANIKSGGSGKWGQLLMPPQPNVSDADARTLAKWILSTVK